MSIKRLVVVLIGVVLVAFGVGFLSLRYNDDYHFVGLESGKRININSGDDAVKIGSDGIDIKSGASQVVINRDGIKIHDGKDQVEIGLDGIRINEGNKSKIRIGNLFSWFSFGGERIKTEIIDEEKFADIDKLDSISISSSFIDVKIIAQDRNDVRIHYYGTLKSNVVPVLEVDKTTDKLNIKLETPNTHHYSVVDSDVVLEVFIPDPFNSNMNVATSSGDIYVEDLLGKDFDISSSSGDMKLNNLEGRIFNLSSSSGDIEANDCIGDVHVSSSSGDISLDNEKTSGDINVSTSSGDIEIELPYDANYKIEGSTSSGRFTPSPKMNIEENNKGIFRAAIGLGKKTISIHTSSGDIRFEER